MKIRHLVEKTVIRMTRSMSLMSKVILFYALIVFIPTVLLAIGASSLALHIVRDNYMLTIKEAVRQSAQSIKFRKQSYDLLAIQAATDGELISRLSRNYADLEEQLGTVEYLNRSFLITSKYLPGIEDFRIYHTNETLVQDGGLLWKPENRMVSGIIEKDWFQLRAQSHEYLNWSNAPDNNSRLVISRKIINSNGDMYGIVYMLLNYNAVFTDLFEHPFDGAGEMFIVDENQNILASSERNDIGHRLPYTFFKEYWSNHDVQESPIHGNLLITQKINDGWTVAALIHLDRLEAQSKRILYSVGWGIAFFLLLSIFLIMTVLKNVIWRIRKLGVRMNDISEGDFEVAVMNRDNDELGEIEVLFNSMSAKLGRLVEAHTQATLKEREQSFKALQAQINPHFIYNSLSLIRWRAMDLKDDLQVRTIDALSTFYRLALNNRVNVTRIRDELDHLKAYMEIQQLRYLDLVHVELQVEPEVLDLYTIKLLLQPIVENCYLHGNITKRKDAFIQISIQRVDDTVQFLIFDNGIGIPTDHLEAIRVGSYTGTNNGFGINNIRERLGLYFGPKGRLSIDSMENGWTAVTIVIPVYKERPEIIRGDE